MCDAGMENTEFRAWLQQKKVSETNSEKLLAAESTSVEMLAGLRAQDLEELGVPKMVARSLINTVAKEEKRMTDHRKGNFGDGGAFSEHGTAIGTQNNSYYGKASVDPKEREALLARAKEELKRRYGEF